MRNELTNPLDESMKQPKTFRKTLTYYKKLQIGKYTWG